MRRGRPHAKDPKSRPFQFRTNEKEANRILWLANTYAGGDVSAWLRHAALTAERKYLKKK
jgi:hypothetical protein